MTFSETFTATLVGADGAGKTTVARMVADTSVLPIEYVYMGMNPQANRFALPTSRLSYLLKYRQYLASKSPAPTDESDPKPDLGHIPRQRGPVLATARLINRLLEEWARQLVVWRSRWRGSIVLCDRHFVLDFSARRLRPRTSKPRLSDRIHKWLLAHAYPHPHLVIFLDAPAELLHERKPDAPLEYLKSRQDYFSRLGAIWPDFVSVDASNEPESVAAEVSRAIEDFHQRRSGNSNQAAR